AKPGLAKLERNMMKSETKLVKLETSMGNIVIELNEQAAPVTVKNFLGYVDEGFFDGTIFHRVMPGFMIQGGGLTAEMEQKETREAIINEAGNGLKNERGTIAIPAELMLAAFGYAVNHSPNVFIESVLLRQSICILQQCARLAIQLPVRFEYSLLLLVI
ncbi:unnamed protein product, partial [marine sediment metagenome]